MTLVSSIITDAYRETNSLALGASPSSDQSTEGLRLLQRVVDATLGNAAGEPLRDWPLGDYGRQTIDQENLSTDDLANPPINRRLVHTAEAAITVYFPPNPSNGSRMSIADPHSRLAALNVTLNGNGRTIETTATQVLNTNGLEREWFYRADIGDWVRVADLATAAEMPFPREFDDLFIILLAMRLSPRYGRKLTAETAEILKQQKRDFRNRYLQADKLAINDDLAINSEQSFEQGWNTSTDDFNRGG